MGIASWLSLVIVVATIVGVAVSRYPFMRVNSATIALAGATALMLLGTFSLPEAYAALDLNTDAPQHQPAQWRIELAHD